MPISFHFLIHRQEIEESLQEQEIAAGALQEQLQSKLITKPKLLSYALAFWNGEPRLKRMARQPDGIDRTVTLTLLIDQYLDHVILRSLLLRVPSLDVGQSAGL